ncbi:tRNA preQ1(34) S-adenosylmethionine ribosyltransferase-isomerase QueA [Candidatus Omnitrophota bacterium]
MKLSEFDYSLPQELIAQQPAAVRDESRLLVLHRESGTIEHKSFKDLGAFLKKGDLVVLNDTKVFKARLVGKRDGFDGKIELLLSDKLDDNTYSCLAKPARKLKEGTKLLFGDGRLRAEIMGYDDEFKRVRFNANGNLPALLNEIGDVPLPPYIKRNTNQSDESRYQTIYAKKEGAIAAPTAGLHFTDEILWDLKVSGIDTAFLTLHVGYGTFRPVTEENVLDHKMHKEYFQVSSDVADRVNSAKKKGARVIAIGTTTTRALESFFQGSGDRVQGAGHAGTTDLFVFPGYEFKAVDALLTNFHLPKTTLFMLVSAFAGRENIIRAYEKAIQEKYRFFSYGDAMLIT